MRVHLHTVTWNDRRMLDYFFRHYDWVEHFWISDDGSTDGTAEILQGRSDVTSWRTVWTNPDSWVDSAREIYNTSWKKSIGAADWVIVTNVDEHLYHPDMIRYLKTMTGTGVTVVPALGYQMISSSHPAPDALLWRDCRMGVPWHMMSKLQLFRPDMIEEIAYKPGRHLAYPRGHVVYPDVDEVINLHFKFLGLEETFERQRVQGQRLGAMDREKGWGRQYFWSYDRLKEEFAEHLSNLVDVHSVDHDATYPQDRWWRARMRRA